jgi:Tol biopolymer transport system component
LSLKRLLSTLLGAVTLAAADHPLAGHKLLVTSLRTGDTEVFIADPVSGDLFNVSRSPASEDRYPCWSPDARRVCFVSDRKGIGTRE